MIVLSEKDIEIAKEVIPNLDELLQDEKNAEDIVELLNDAMISTMDKNDIPSDFGRECERIMDDINYRYLAKKMLTFTEKEIDFLSEAGIYASDLESDDLDVYNKAYDKLEAFIMSNFNNGEPNEKALIGEGIFDKLAEKQ